MIRSIRGVSYNNIAASGYLDSSQQHSDFSRLSGLECNLIIHSRVKFDCHVVDILGPHADIPLVLRGGVLRTIRGRPDDVPVGPVEVDYWLRTGVQSGAKHAHQIVIAGSDYASVDDTVRLVEHSTQRHFTINQLRREDSCPPQLNSTVLIIGVRSGLEPCDVY